MPSSVARAGCRRESAIHRDLLQGYRHKAVLLGVAERGNGAAQKNPELVAIDSLQPEAFFVNSSPSNILSIAKLRFLFCQEKFQRLPGCANGDGIFAASNFPGC
jgi:hypothetical protein